MFRLSLVKRRPIAALALIILIFGTSGLLAGCSEEVTRLDLAPIPAPEGGSIPAIALVTQGDESTIIVPTKKTFYSRQTSKSRWEPTPTTLPKAFVQEGYNVYDSLSRHRAAQDFPSSQLFASRKDELWTIAAPSFQNPARLLVSIDAAKTWTEITLPTNLPTGPTNLPNTPDDANNPTSDDQNSADFAKTPRPSKGKAPSQFRVLVTAEDSLFLTDSSQIWQFLATSSDIQQLTETSKTIDATNWKRISMEGVDFSQPSQTTGLPAVLRNYLPATTERPYELLTVLHDQLLLYHRNTGTEQWLLTSTLPTVDRHLLDIAGLPSVYLLTSDAIYRSEDDGQVWERVQFSGRGLQSTSNNSLFAILAPDEPTGHILFLGSHDGSIRRSTDAGQTWKDSQLRDLDQRAITGFVLDPIDQKLWASTAGNGILTSTDLGLTWTLANNDLRATTALTIASGPSNELLLGTDSGLFRLTGDPRNGNWSPLHKRATSALYVNPENQRIFSGTLGGSIVVLHADSQETTSEAAPLGEHNSVIFRPPNLDSTYLPAPAIVDIRPRPKSQEMFAWSYQQGPLNSNDAGASWRRMRLSDALTTALHAQIITDFATDQDQRLFVVSRSTDFANPSQLWRSQNNGDSWHAIYFYLQNSTDSPLRIERDLQHAPEMLFLIHSNNIAYSLDQGTAWTTLNGPWQNGNIATFSIIDQQAVIVSNMLHSSEIFFINLSELTALRTNSDITRYSLNWPINQRPASEETLAIVTNNRHLFITDAHSVYVGTLPRQRNRLPEGIAVILTIIGLLILTGASFAFLRQR